MVFLYPVAEQCCPPFPELQVEMYQCFTVSTCVCVCVCVCVWCVWRRWFSDMVHHPSQISMPFVVAYSMHRLFKSLTFMMYNYTLLCVCEQDLSKIIFYSVHVHVSCLKTLPAHSFIAFSFNTLFWDSSTCSVFRIS